MKLTSDTEDVFICRVYNDLNQILFGQGQITITGYIKNLHKITDIK